MSPWLFRLCVLCVPAVSIYIDAAYDELAARAFAQYSRATFCQEESLKSWACGDACDAVPIVAGKIKYIPPQPIARIAAFVAQIPETPGQDDRQFLGRTKCILAFRGSIEKRNWYADMDIFKVSWPTRPPFLCEGCLAHKGFAAAYDELSELVHEALEDLKCRSLAITGHSLGGAVATLATADLRLTTQLMISPTYTFGSPRVGNDLFAEALAELASRQQIRPPTWRVVHYKDPAPHVPWAWESFKHVLQEVYYDTEQSNHFVQCNSTNSEDKACSDQWCSWLWCIENMLNLDHLTYFNMTFAYRHMDAKCTTAAQEMILTM